MRRLTLIFTLVVWMLGNIAIAIVVTSRHLPRADGLAMAILSGIVWGATMLFVKRLIDEG